MAKNKELKCKNCIFYKNDNCTHKSNTGILIKYRKETNFYVKKAEELVLKCENYKENGIEF